MATDTPSTTDAPPPPPPPPPPDTSTRDKTAALDGGDRVQSSGHEQQQTAGSRGEAGPRSAQEADTDRLGTVRENPTDTGDHQEGSRSLGDAAPEPESEGTSSAPTATQDKAAVLDGAGTAESGDHEAASSGDDGRTARPKPGEAPKRTDIPAFQPAARTAQDKATALDGEQPPSLEQQDGAPLESVPRSTEETDTERPATPQQSADHEPQGLEPPRQGLEPKPEFQAALDERRSTTDSTVPQDARPQHARNPESGSVHGSTDAATSSENSGSTTRAPVTTAEVRESVRSIETVHEHPTLMPSGDPGSEPLRQSDPPAPDEGHNDVVWPLSKPSPLHEAEPSPLVSKFSEESIEVDEPPARGDGSTEPPSADIPAQAVADRLVDTGRRDPPLGPQPHQPDQTTTNEGLPESTSARDPADGSPRHGEISPTRSPLDREKLLPTLSEDQVRRGPDGLIDSIDGRSANDYLHQLAGERRQGYQDARENGSIPRSEVAPVVSDLLDRRTGRLYESVNSAEPPRDLHPILQERLDQRNRTAEGNPEGYEYSDGTRGGYPHFSVAGTHAEVHNASRALHDREALGYPATSDSLHEMTVDNYFPYRPSEKSAAPCCANCTAILGDSEGVESIPGKISNRLTDR